MIWQLTFLAIKQQEVDRSDGCKGGGTLIYFAEDSNAYKCRDLFDQLQIEVALVDMSFHSQKLLVGSIYRPPDCMNFFKVFPWLMENLWKANAQTLSRWETLM